MKKMDYYIKVNIGLGTKLKSDEIRVVEELRKAGYPTSKAIEAVKNLRDAKPLSPYDVTRVAVTAALEAIDNAIPDARKSKGPLGDRLAGDLHVLIEDRIQRHMVGEH